MTSSVEQARAGVEAARAAFLAEPTAELEQRVEDAERELRRAERFAEADVSRRTELARQAEETARAVAKAELAELEASRDAKMRELSNLIENVTLLYGELDPIILQLEQFARRDSELVADILVTARRAGLQRRTEAVTTTLVRDALRVRLARDFEAPRATGEGPLPTFQIASARVNSPGTRSQRHQRLRDASDAWVVDTNAAELADWLTLFLEPEWEFLQVRHAAAEELLATLKPETTEDADGE